MFGIDSGELLIIALVALVVIGPKDLPRAMRTIGQWTARARGMARHFRSGMDTMIREAEFEDMEKKWKGDNARIMREHPQPSADDEWAEPVIDDEAGMEPAAGSKPEAPPPRRKSSAPPIPAAAPRAPPPAGERR